MYACTHSRNAKNGGERQERLCVWGSISWPSSRLASYLLNETVPTDLDNRTRATRRLHRARLGLRVPVPEQRRQPWTTLWVDMRDHIIGSFRCRHYSLIIIRSWMWAVISHPRYADRKNLYSFSTHTSPVWLRLLSLASACGTSQLLCRLAEKHPADLACILSLFCPGPIDIYIFRCTPGTRCSISVPSVRFNPKGRGMLSGSHAHGQIKGALQARWACHSPSVSMDEIGAHSWGLTDYLPVHKSLIPLRAANQGKAQFILAREVTGEDGLRLRSTCLSRRARAWLSQICGPHRGYGHLEKRCIYVKLNSEAVTRMLIAECSKMLIILFHRANFKECAKHSNLMAYAYHPSWSG